MAEHTGVMISSTARDLPDHRKEAMDACLRQSMFPIIMEHLPACDSDAIAASLKMVDDAEIYVGIFAFRYGYRPKENNPSDISITEMEYYRAVESAKERLIFLMHDDHPKKAEDVEKGEGAVKLLALKERLKTEHVVNFFRSPHELRAQIIDSLSKSKYHQRNLAAFHYVSDIPNPPEAYIAHPYTLLQTEQVIGRQTELNLLTDWVSKPDLDVYKARILNVVSIGGMGKSALTWKWFKDIALQDMKPLAGRLWWSFYESDASFKNFVIRTLAYVTGKSREDVQKTPQSDRELQLLAILDREPFLLVLDGLERTLIAYARMDAPRLADDDLDERTAQLINSINIAYASVQGGVVTIGGTTTIEQLHINMGALAANLPIRSTVPALDTAQSFFGKHKLRKTTDPRVGNFLRRLANVKASRILVSSRLYPADLQKVTGDPLPGCFALFLTGLSDDDALNLWQAFGVSGSRETLLLLFHTFGNFPLLIRALAGEVAIYRRAPGDFDAWHRANPRFNPFRMDLKQAKSHVLEFALQGLDETARKVLHTIAAFRMPTTYDRLVALLVGEVGKPFTNEHALDDTLTELEDRSLLGWDRRASANRYDLHPIVRGVAWSALDDEAKRGVYETLHTHFESVPKIDDWRQVNSVEDLTPAIELYSALIGLRRYDDARVLFSERLARATLSRLSSGRLRAELVEMLFPEGLDQLPHLSKTSDQAWTFNALALAYDISGQPGRATPLYRRHNAFREKEGNQASLRLGLNNLANVLWPCGELRASETAARQSLFIAREQDNYFSEAVSLRFVGLVLIARGVIGESETALRRSQRLFISLNRSTSEGATNAFLAQRALWLGDPGTARLLADRAWELAQVRQSERGFIRAARMQGAAGLGLGDLATASERLHHALTRARAVNFVEEELPALVALAEVRRREDVFAAREILDDIWELAERGPYPLDHADAFNVLAQIERDSGNHEAAVKAATEAYRKTWCDGPPFAYHWGLEAARAHLRALGAPEPDMPPYEESKYEPMPKVEISLPDEFGAG